MTSDRRDRDRGSDLDLEEPEIRPENIRAIRLGHGGNCSSVGSVIDTLFLSAAVGGAIFAAVCAAMREEPIHVMKQPVVDLPVEEDEVE